MDKNGPFLADSANTRKYPHQAGFHFDALYLAFSANQFESRN